MKTVKITITGPEVLDKVKVFDEIDGYTLGNSTAYKRIIRVLEKPNHEVKLNYGKFYARVTNTGTSFDVIHDIGTPVQSFKYSEATKENTMQYACIRKDAIIYAVRALCGRVYEIDLDCWETALEKEDWKPYALLSELNNRPWYAKRIVFKTARYQVGAKTRKKLYRLYNQKNLTLEFTNGTPWTHYVLNQCRLSFKEWSCNYAGTTEIGDRYWRVVYTDKQGNKQFAYESVKEAMNSTNYQASELDTLMAHISDMAEFHNVPEDELEELYAAYEAYFNGDSDEDFEDLFANQEYLLDDLITSKYSRHLEYDNARCSITMNSPMYRMSPEELVIGD